MTFHFPDQVETNRLTIEANDPKSGTSEFKATAIRVEKLPAAVRGSLRRGPEADDGGALRRRACARSTRCSARPRPAGPAASGPSRDLRVSRAPEDQRTLLLPVLHALQERFGWISEGGLNYACERLDGAAGEAYGVATFYAMFSVRSAAKMSCMSATTSPAGCTRAGVAESRSRPRARRRRCLVGAQPVPRDVRAGARGPRATPGGPDVSLGGATLATVRAVAAPGADRLRRRGHRAADMAPGSPREPPAPRARRARGPDLDRDFRALDGYAALAARGGAGTRRRDPRGHRR